jgi:hypothetical protein
LQAGPTSGGAYGELILASLLDFINFLQAISFYILAKSIIYLVIFRETLGVALSGSIFGEIESIKCIASRY